MKFGIIFVITLILGTIFTSSLILASSHNDDEKPRTFGIWEAIRFCKEKIAVLFDRIEEIEQTPGPQGPPGQNGTDGDQGPPGPQGPSAIGGGLFYIDAFDSCPTNWTQFDMNFNPFGADMLLDVCYRTDLSCITFYQEEGDSCPTGFSLIELNNDNVFGGGNVDVCALCQ